MADNYAHEIQVRFADTDQQGHVFFANYLTFCDEALTGYMRAIGCPWQSLVASGIDMVYRAAAIEFIGKARFEDRLAIRAHIARIGNTSFDSEYAMSVGDTIVARARLTSVCVDAASHEPRPVPKPLRDAVATWGPRVERE